MEKAKVRQLREMLALAKKLRDSAAGSADRASIDLFLRMAGVLEGRAHSLAYGSFAKSPGGEAKTIRRVPVDLTC